MKPLISVCMASYNHKPYIRRTVESVLNQTFKDFEFIITDDGSSDGTLDAISGIKDDRLHIYKLPQNMGACVAKNQCIYKARGEYIANINSDDTWEKEKLALQLKVMEKHSEVGAVFTNVQIIDENDLPYPGEHIYKSVFATKNKSSIEWLMHLIMYGNVFCHPSSLIRKKVYDKVGYYDERLMQTPDYDLWIRALEHFEFFIIDKKLINFRILPNAGNTSGTSIDAKARGVWENVLMMRKAFKRANPKFEVALRNGGLIHPSKMAVNTNNSKCSDPFSSRLTWEKLNTYLKMAAALEYFDKLNPYQPCEEPSQMPQDYLKSIRNLDLLNVKKIEELEKLEIQIHSQETLNAILQSNSWKITRPLRICKNYMDKIFR